MWLSRSLRCFGYLAIWVLFFFFYLSFLFFHLVLLPRPSRSRFHFLPPPSVAAISPRTFRTRTPDEIHETLSKLFDTDLGNARNRSGGKQRDSLLRFGGDSREREISVLLLSLVEYRWHVRVWSSSASCNRGERQYTMRQINKLYSKSFFLTGDKCSNFCTIILFLPLFFLGLFPAFPI